VTDQTAAPTTFVLWLDASDGSVPTHDGVVWPDGSATIHHRHFGITTTHHSAEAACQAAHGKQGRLVWAEPTDQAYVLRKAAVRIDRENLPQDQADMFDNGARWATSMMRRMANEAQLASSSTPEPPGSKFKENAKTLNSAIGAQPAPPDRLRCVCGDPVQLMDDNDPTSWIHKPGSDTRCLEARPRCPHGQMPHAMTPSMQLACASIRASVHDQGA
jgi:hypothetical protein